MTSYLAIGALALTVAGLLWLVVKDAFRQTARWLPDRYVMSDLRWTELDDLEAARVLRSGIRPHG